MSKEQRPRVGFGVMILHEGKVLLGKRHDDPEKADSALHGEGTWTMPGGKLDFGERLADAAIRELVEETGLKADPNKLKLISLTDDALEDVHFVTAGFLCEDFEGEPQVMEPDEITKWEWFDIGSLPSPMYFPSQKVMDHYLSKNIYANT